MALPDYQGGSIVNLMQSIVAGLGDRATGDHPPHPEVPPELVRESRHVVLVVIDGLGFDYLMRVRPDGAIASLLRGSLTSVFPSTTTSAVTTFLTADAPRQHALTGWYMWLREAGVVAAPLPFRIRAGGGNLRDLGVLENSVFDRTPVFDQVRRNSFMVQPAHLSSSVYTRANQGRAVLKPYRTLSGFFARVRRLTASKTPSYIYAYWPELDTLGHRHGMESVAAADHLAEIDGQVARLLAKIRGRGATLLVTADHGFVDTRPDTWVNLEDHPELKDMLAVPLCGEPRAAYCYVHHGAAEDFVAYVRERLSTQCELLSADELLEGNYFGLGATHARLKDRIGHYCLIMRGNYAIRDRLATERRVKVMVGVHGGTTASEMKVPLALKSA
ncbi:MAG: alkaline phosphatase family protein [Gammaproteobacteria bacterium]|nr:alkaline phosphatase family protein [Gammaproteobacteria bacterium]